MSPRGVLFPVVACVAILAAVVPHAQSAPQESVLTELLKGSQPARDISVKLFTYTLRDAGSDKFRILLAADVDRTANPDGRLALAFSVADETGRVLDTQIEREVKAAVHPRSKIQTYTGSVVTGTTGAHTLKVAVVDDQDKRGTAEHTFRATLTPVGPVQATDLLISDAARPESGTPAPMGGTEITSGTMHGYIELYAEAADILKSATVIFEVAQNEQGRALDGASGRAKPPAPEAPNRRTIEGSIPLALLAPGEYVVRAVVNVDGRRVGQITRPLRVGRLMAATPKTTAPVSLRPATAIKAAPIPFTSRIEKFDRASVLTPQVVGFFVDRMKLGGRDEATANPVLEHAREGRFDEAFKALNTGTATVAGAFLSGLALYAKGELEPAAARFRDALRLDSEFFPAAFYLGSCYAAGGRDSEAVGAWQLSLVTEGEARFIYTLLGDALLRLREIDQAFAILNEALASWPDDEEVHVRLGAAYAMSGKRAEALQKLEPYLAKHPDDHERLFIALRTLHEARVEGKPVRTREEDRAQFARWAAAYAAAKGPNQAVVNQWQKSMR
jgi:tetratricopeptide (TPR) repeat protein